MRYELGQNSRVLYGEVPFIGNTTNGSFIALTNYGLKFIEKLQSGNDISTESLSANNKQILNTALELGIIVEKGVQFGHTNEFGFSAAYLHITNHCNYHCVGCYSHESYRNQSQDLSTEEMIGILKSLSSLGVKTLVISGGEPFIREDVVLLLRTAKHDLGFEKIIVASKHVFSFSLHFTLPF